MRLYVSKTSPFVRKVLLVAIETGLDGRIERLPVKTLPTAPDVTLGMHNPLNKIPALMTDDGQWLYDSRVICEYLDSLHEGPRLIPTGRDRFTVLRTQALADGIIDAAVLVRYESMRPAEQQSNAWVKGQLLKVEQGMRALESDLRAIAGPLHLGQLAVASAVGYLEFREVGGNLRVRYPRLYAWYQGFSERPSMQATVPVEA